MKVQTRRFGDLEIAEESVIELPEGLVGIDEAKRFCVLEESPDSPVRWLQIVDEPALAFVAVNPYDFFPDYEIEVSGEDAADLGLEEAQDAAIFVLLTIGSKDGSDITANLVAPVVVCNKTNRAKQIVLQSERYTTKHLLGECLAEAEGARSA